MAVDNGHEIKKTLVLSERLKRGDSFRVSPRWQRLSFLTCTAACSLYTLPVAVRSRYLSVSQHGRGALHAFISCQDLIW